MRYEDLIRKRAAKIGGEVMAERDGLRVTTSHGSVWHRLGGDAENRFNQRVAEGQDPEAEGRWVGTQNATVWKEGRP